MKIVVTGGSGKLGGYVVPELQNAGHEVIIFDRNPPAVPSSARFTGGTIESLPDLTAALAEAEAVLHLAGIPTFGIEPDDVTFRINVMGAFNVHEAARVNAVPLVVSLSSEAVLGWSPGSWQTEHLPDYLPIDEQHACAPQDCYGLSKQVLEDVGRSFSARCGLTTVFLRATWIASPEELEELAKVGGRRPKEFTLCHYVDARDLAVACRKALESRLAGSHAIYIGSGQTCVAEPLSTLFPRLAPGIGAMASSLEGQKGAVSVDLAYRLLGWKPEHLWKPHTSN